MHQGSVESDRMHAPALSVTTSPDPLVMLKKGAQVQLLRRVVPARAQMRRRSRPPDAPTCSAVRGLWCRPPHARRSHRHGRLLQQGRRPEQARAPAAARITQAAQAAGGRHPR